MQSSRSSEGLRKAIPVSLLSGGFGSAVGTSRAIRHGTSVSPSELISTGSFCGQLLPDIEKVAARLADQAGVAETWRPLVTELAGVEWNVPRGLTVREVTLMLPGDSDRDLPSPPREFGRLFAVWRSRFWTVRRSRSSDPGRQGNAPCSPRFPSSGV